MTLLLSSLLLPILTGCAGKQVRQTSAILQGTWMEVCPGGNPEQTWIRLQEDGRFDFSYSPDEPFNQGDDETWAHEKNVLILSWSDGYAVTRYDLRKLSTGRLPGMTSKSCSDGIELVRL